MRSGPPLALGPLVLLLATTGTAAAQEGPRPAPLAGSRIEIPEPMTLITGLQPLPDGRVVVVDAMEKAIRIADFGTRGVVQIGREGAGPNEYRTPRTTLRWKADTVLVYDGGARRFLKVAPNGSLHGEIPIPGSLFMGRGVTPPRWASASGVIYFEIEPLDFLDDQNAPRRAIVARWVPGTERLDSVAALMTHEPGRPTRGRAHFLRHDGWAVTADDRLGVARALVYRVEWSAPGEPARIGPTVEYSPVQVTDDERRAMEAAVSSGPRAGASLSGGTGREQTTPSRSSGGARVPDYPETKPPFEAHDRLGRPGVVASTTGELWVTRSRAWNDSIPIVDVFDASARLVRRVRLPPNTRVLHVDRDAVYLARRDADDLEWLSRIRR